MLPIFEDKRAQFAMISAAITIQQLEFTGGFYYSASDLSGQFAGVVFGMSNTMAQVSGFMGPLAIAYMAPNVSVPSFWAHEQKYELGKKFCIQLTRTAFTFYFSPYYASAEF